MSAIATFRTAIAKLLDDSTNARYSNDQIDQALRQALQEYSRVRPYLQTYNVNGTGERVLEMPADFAGWFAVLIFGLALGLVASGFYKFLDARLPKVQG